MKPASTAETLSGVGQCCSAWEVGKKTVLNLGIVLFPTGGSGGNTALWFRIPIWDRFGTGYSTGQTELDFSQNGGYRAQEARNGSETTRNHPEAPVLHLEISASLPNSA